MDTPTTPPIDLGAIEARLNAATPGPWRTQTAACDHPDRDEHAAVKGGGYLVVDCAEDANADLIAHAPEDLRALLAEVRRLTDALATARLDGARVMREAAAVSLESAVWTTDTRFSRVQAEEVAAIRALDPAAVVGSGSSIHAVLPSPDTYQWSATGPNGCLLLSPAGCIVARIDRDGTGWRPQIPGRGPLKWAADFPSAVRQVREVLGDVVPDGSAAVVGSGS